MRDAAEAAELLARHAGSGMSLAAWCVAEGIDGRSLSGYRNQLPAGPRLVEVAAPAAEAAPPAVYRVVVGPLAVEVSDDFRSDTLSRLLAVVSGC